MEFHSLKEQREQAVDAAEARAAAAAAAAASADADEPKPSSSRPKRSRKKPSTPASDELASATPFAQAMVNPVLPLEGDDAHDQPIEDATIPSSGLGSEEHTPEATATADAASPSLAEAEEPPMRPHNLMAATEIIQNGGDPLSPFTPQPILRLNAIRIAGGASKALRPSFLASLCRPYMDPTLSQQNPNPPLLSSLYYGGRTSHPLPGQPTTLASILGLTSSIAGDLDKLDVFRNIEASLAPSIFPGATEEDVDVILACGKPKGRVFLKSSTDVGNGEGSASVQGRIRNVFGGAETLQGRATFGTRTKQAFNLEFGAPLPGNPDIEYKLSAFSHDRDYSAFASLSEGIRGLRASINSSHTTEPKGVINPNENPTEGITTIQHEIAYEASLRELNRVTKDASVAVRKMAVHPSVKSALSWTWVRESRNSSVLPSQGWKHKGVLEYAGLGGDAKHVRAEVEASTGRHFSPLSWLIPTLSSASSSSPSATSNPAPFVADNVQKDDLTTPNTSSSVAQEELSKLAWTLHPVYSTFTFRSGLLTSHSSPTTHTPNTHFSDRFQLGGPTSIRSYRHNSLGPKSSTDSLGGDAYWSTGLSLLTPIPRKPHWPIMLHAYANAGQLCQLDPRKSGEAYWKGLKELAQPSSSVGLGLVYMQGPLRVELNAGVPITSRQGDGSRKGLQLGIGIDFL